MLEHLVDAGSVGALSMAPDGTALEECHQRGGGIGARQT
jgi:hypothetical protein